MARKTQFGDGILFTIGNYIWWFLIGNLYFALTNILFIFVWLGTSADTASSFNILTVIALLPAGPSLVALFSVMGKLIRVKDVDITKDFFSAYRKNFLEALFYWALFLIISSILYVDIIYFNSKTQLMPVKYIIIIIAFILFSMIFYILPIISRFYFKKRDLLKLSFYYSLKKLNITLLNWAYLIVLSYISLRLKSNLLVLSFWSIFGYLIMFNEKSVLAEIEEKYLNLNSSDNN